MSRNASDIYKVIKLNREKHTVKSVQAFKEKCTSALTDMMKDGEFFIEVEIEESDVLGFDSVLFELRGLGYKYCLIEVQNEKEEVISSRLRISVGE